MTIQVVQPIVVVQVWLITIVTGVVFLINSDTKSQKGDSEPAAAASILSEKIMNSAATNEKDIYIGAENKDLEYQDVKENKIDEGKKKCSSTSPKDNKNIKTKKRQKNLEKNRRRYAIAFQQRQQKQFTYSVSYFNWAVSDEEEEDEEFSHELSSSSTPRHSRSSTSGFERNSHNGSKNGFLYQQRKCNKTINKWGEELPIEDEVSELAVISPSAKGIVLTEEFIEVTLPFKRLAIAKNKKY